MRRSLTQLNLPTLCKQICPYVPKLNFPPLGPKRKALEPTVEQVDQLRFPRGWSHLNRI